MAKVRHLVMQNRHRTRLVVDGAAMSDRLPLNSVLLSGEEDTGKVGMGGYGCGGRGGVVMLVPGEESYVAQGEVVWGGVCSILAVFSWTQEVNESETGEISDDLLSGCALLVGFV